MKRRMSFPIEYKILIPFVCISLITVACFCLIFYRTEYDLKMESETLNAQAVVTYINADINADGYWRKPGALLAKYQSTCLSDNLFLYDRDGTLLLGRRALSQDEIILLDSTENRLGWRVQYSLNSRALRDTFIEEQRYMLLAAIAMLLIIVQTSVFIAHNISSPIRQLSAFCTQISRAPGAMKDLTVEYTQRGDEIGRLAVAFQAMMESQRRYTDELTRVKLLNESIVENLPLGVAVYDRAGKLVFQNSRALDMLARAEERDETGRDLGALLTGIICQNDFLPAPARMQDQDGKVRDYEFGVWRLGNSDASAWETLCTIDDVTYKKYMEEKLSRDEKLAYTGQLAAHVAHEARNPLAGIRAGLQVIGRKLTDGRDQLLCQEMVKEVDRVNLLIENLLNLSRKRESEKSAVNLNNLCGELLMLYGKVAANKGISLTAEMDGELWVLADEQELRQVFINLINNSIKALPNGGRVTLLGAAAPDGVAVTIQDDGPGMDARALEQAMQGAGGGLGLSIVQHLLGQNGAILHMDSVPGQGTRARLTFHGKGETL